MKNSIARHRLNPCDQHRFHGNTTIYTWVDFVGGARPHVTHQSHSVKTDDTKGQPKLITGVSSIVIPFKSQSTWRSVINLSCSQRKWKRHTSLSGSMKIKARLGSFNKCLTTQYLIHLTWNFGKEYNVFPYNSPTIPHETSKLPLFVTTLTRQSSTCSPYNEYNMDLRATFATQIT